MKTLKTLFLNELAGIQPVFLAVQFPPLDPFSGGRIGGAILILIVANLLRK